MYLLPEVNLQLRPTILALRPGTRIVSHDWDMGDWKPDRTMELAVPDKTIGLEKSSRVHLWIVPARVEGLWCGTQGRRRATLRLRQAFQFVAGEIEVDGEPLGAVSGGIEGSAVSLALRRFVGAPACKRGGRRVAHARGRRRPVASEGPRVEGGEAGAPRAPAG